MIKRLFLLSGIIALALAVLTMYYWYLPNQEAESSLQNAEVPTPESAEMPADSIAVE